MVVRLVRIHVYHAGARGELAPATPFSASDIGMSQSTKHAAYHIALSHVGHSFRISFNIQPPTVTDDSCET